MSEELAEVVRAFGRHPGLRAKAHLGLVAEVLGETDWVSGPGDDAAVVESEGQRLLIAAEAIWPPLVEAEPFGAGAAAVVANVNDIAAMGGRPLAIVDTVVGPEPLAKQVLEGLRFASGLYGVPVVGGHLTVREGPPAVSAFAAGRAVKVLASRNVAPGQSLLLACCLEGRLRDDFPFFSSLRERGDRLAEDLDLLPQIAEAGICLAAKDVSMAGLLGSLATLLEPTATGAVIELERIPRPEGVPLPAWTSAFPSYAFFLATPTSEAAACRETFARRGLACEVIGEIDGTGRLRARLGREEVLLADLAREGVTRLRKP